VAAEVCVPPEVAKEAGRPHCQPDRWAPAEVEAEDLRPDRQGAEAAERRLRLGPQAAVVPTGPSGPEAAELQVPAPQLVPVAAEGLERLAPARRSPMQ
jgi:hypothetical protein